MRKKDEKRKIWEKCKEETMEKSEKRKGLKK